MIKVKKFTLIDQLIFRVFKQFNYFPLLFNFYSSSNTLMAIQRARITKNTITLYSLAYNTELKKYILNTQYEKMNQLFNIMLWKKVYSLLEDFIIQNNLIHKLDNGLQKTTFQHKTYSLDGYIQYNIHKKANILDFFINSFSWSESEDGYSFWSHIDNEFKTLIYQFLMKCSLF